MDISKIDVGAIRGHADAATPGPWTSIDHYPHVVFQGGEENIVATNLAGDPLADGAFIAHAREDIPALLAVVETVLRLHAADAAAAAEFAAGLDGSALEILRTALADEAGQRGGNEETANVARAPQDEAPAIYAPTQRATADSFLDTLRDRIAAYRRAIKNPDGEYLPDIAAEVVDASAALDKILVAGAALPRAWRTAAPVGSTVHVESLEVLRG